ncbi:amidase [Paenarthrobacter nitroguajacolicus]|uniref:amidase n=1 Tax=Paenarthrobacter nitroguajacolicus TaxID=211146 RepID=UPI00285B97D5|nr:amidase [Paenarthrobacter nitroguajacolicus]MDR6989143.1 amidase [Paenarthrobacter nitroguajacolicus]
MDPFASATSLATAIRNKEISPVEVVESYLERIDAGNPLINAIIWRNDDDVLAAAREAERALLANEEIGPFHGVPIPIKDLSDVAGQPNTQSSLSIDPHLRDESDLSVLKLQRAGFLLMGRTNSPELGPLTVSENPRHGATRNPWNPEFTPGGSSGGAAAAVAAGFAPVAHASDGGGSIRVPSSACGLVGLKPSRGRVPQAVFAWEHSTVQGAITRTVEDAAGLLDAMSGQDTLAWYSAPQPDRPFSQEPGTDPGRLRVGVLLDAPTGMPVDEECVEAALKLAKMLEDAGHVVFPATPQLFSAEAIEAFQIIISASVWATPFDDPSKVDPYIAHRIRQAEGFHSGQYASAAAMMQVESRKLVSQWGRDFDVLLTPTMATTTPRVGVVREEANANPGGLRETELRMISFTSFCNTAGLPAVSLPVHTDATGLPVGAQLVGGPFAEATLFRLAAQAEDHFRWQDRIAGRGDRKAATAGTGFPPVAHLGTQP